MFEQPKHIFSTPELRLGWSPTITVLTPDHYHSFGGFSYLPNTQRYSIFKQRFYSFSYTLHWSKLTRPCANRNNRSVFKSRALLELSVCACVVGVWGRGARRLSAPSGLQALLCVCARVVIRTSYLLSWQLQWRLGLNRYCAYTP